MTPLSSVFRYAIPLVLLSLTAAACVPDIPVETDDPEMSGPADLGAPRPDLVPVDLAPLDSAGPPDMAPAGECLGALGKRGKELLLALGVCITPHTSLGYNDGRDAMFLLFSDPAMNHSIECTYTGRKAMPVKDRATANAASFNTEHTWPQSLGATGVAMADIHHLFPTDVSANGKRGNYPFGVVMTATWTGPDPDGSGASKLGKDAKGVMVFEPRNRVKGDIARALFYFYTRYAQTPPADFSTVNFKVEEPLLHTWHQVDPPDVAERAHNDEIFRLQKNRNPYIDHPEYVEQIGNFLQ